MGRYFNIGGPCNPAKHYTLPAMARLPQVLRVSLRQPLRLSSAREHALCAAVAAYRWPAQEETA